MIRYSITLDRDEAEILSKWADREMRDIKDQIRFILRNELLRQGLLVTDEENQLNISINRNINFGTDEPIKLNKNQIE